MRTWAVVPLLVATVALNAACDSAAIPTAPSASARPESATVNTVLARAIEDEYRAETIYEGVIKDFGNVLPFVNVINAEVRHSTAVAGLLRSRGLAVPPSPWTVDNVPHFATLRDACAAGATAERENIALYDDLLRGDLPADVRQVFTNNRRASADAHLPAFVRCS